MTVWYRSDHWGGIRDQGVVPGIDPGPGRIMYVNQSPCILLSHLNQPALLVIR